MDHTGRRMMMKLSSLTTTRGSPIAAIPCWSVTKIERTDSHLLFLLTLNNRLFLAPLDNPKVVLDIGTGIGIWAQYELEMAQSCYHGSLN